TDRFVQQSPSIMKVIENKFSNYNETQRSILFYLFLNGSATVSELSAHTGINENTIRTYLNTFMNENLIDRLSVKKRDINAKYVFKKQ
ncbi:MAG: winged helix-turn-helix transcriptional regulator, partial [Acinetobacter junii]